MIKKGTIPSNHIPRNHSVCAGLTKSTYCQVPTNLPSVASSAIEIKMGQMIKWRMVRKLAVTIFGFSDLVFNLNTEWLCGCLFFSSDHRPVTIVLEPLLPFVTVIRWQSSFIIELYYKLLPQLHHAPFIHFQTPWRRENHTRGLFDNLFKLRCASNSYAYYAVIWQPESISYSLTNAPRWSPRSGVSKTGLWKD